MIVGFNIKNFRISLQSLVVTRHRPDEMEFCLSCPSRLRQHHDLTVAAPLDHNLLLTLPAVIRSLTPEVLISPKNRVLGLLQGSVRY